jgi:fructoselysine 6-kinase
VKVVAVGECTIDRYPVLGAERVGGISLNFAVHARGAGAESVMLVSCTGDDRGAASIRHRLATAGVDASRVHEREGATASQRIELSDAGERVFPPGGYDPGVLADFRLDAADLAEVREADVVAVPVFRQLMPLVDAVVREPRPRMLRVADLLDGEDLGAAFAGLDPLLEAFDLLFLSGAPALVDRLSDRTRDARGMLVITHGAAGATAISRGSRVFEPAEAVPRAECVDSTGCGDAFQAACTVQLARGSDIGTALRAGAQRAARVLRHLGATASA